MSFKNHHQPAMPLSVALNDVGDSLSSEDVYEGSGLTKLEYFAGQAMQGILSCHGFSASSDRVAEVSIRNAQRLLLELQRQSK